MFNLVLSYFYTIQFQVYNEAEYFQVQGLLDHLSLSPEIFTKIIRQQQLDKYKVNHWKQLVLKSAQNKALESLTTNSSVTIICSNDHDYFHSRENCYHGCHSIALETSARNKEPVYTTEGYSRFEKRLSSPDCVISDITSDCMVAFIELLESKFREESYKVDVVRHSVKCQNQRGPKATTRCNYSLNYYEMKFDWGY